MQQIEDRSDVHIYPKLTSNMLSYTILSIATNGIGSNKEESKLQPLLDLIGLFVASNIEFSTVGADSLTAHAIRNTAKYKSINNKIQALINDLEDVK